MELILLGVCIAGTLFMKKIYIEKRARVLAPIHIRTYLLTYLFIFRYEIILVKKITICHSDGKRPDSTIYGAQKTIRSFVYDATWEDTVTPSHIHASMLQLCVFCTRSCGSLRNTQANLWIRNFNSPR